MTRWQVFQLLAECLRPALTPTRPRLPDVVIPWERVVEASSDHLVSPALGWCLRHDDRVPGDVLTFCETFLELNRDRNVVMLAGLELAVAALNAAGITPMLLKGTAALADGLYPEPGMRLLADIDLMIPTAQLPAAATALAGADFIVSGPASFDREHHHLPLQVHSRLYVGVELHGSAVPRRFGRLVDVDACWRDARPIQWRQSRVFVPSPIDRVAHNITHAQIVDGHYWRGAPRLRQLLELALLRTRHSGAIDAAALEHRFWSAGYADVLADTLLWSRALLEHRDSQLSPTSQVRLQRLQRVVEDPQGQRWEVYRRMVARNSRRVIENPRFLLNVLRPGFWQSELDGIRRRLTLTRW